MRQGAAAALLLAAGCGTPAPPPAPPVTLSTRDTGANVAPIVDFFRRTCVEASSDNRAFAAAVASSGWPLRQEHAQGEDGPSRWRFDHGDLTQFRLSQTSLCALSLDSLVSPTPAALRAALGPLLQRQGYTVTSELNAEAGWSRPSGTGFRSVLTITIVPASEGRTYGAGRQAVTISFARERIPAPRGDQGE